jgi:hypothetical protein
VLVETLNGQLGAQSAAITRILPGSFAPPKAVGLAKKATTEIATARKATPVKQ